MKTLKTELKQHFVSAYVNQHLADRAGHPEEWNIDSLILAAEALFDKYLDEPLGKNWDYEALKKVLVYARDFPAPYIGTDWGNPQHSADACAYAIKALYPWTETENKEPVKYRQTFHFPTGIPDSHNDVFTPKAKVFNGSDFPNDENNRYFWEIKESKLTHGSIDPNDLSDKKFNCGVDELSPLKPYPEAADVLKYSTPVRPMMEMGSHVLSPEELKQKVKEWRELPIARLPYSAKSKDEFQVKSKLIFGSTSNDGVNWEDQFGDTAKQLSVIRWFEAQGTTKHLSIAKRLREIAGIVGEIHDEIIIEL